MSNRIDPMQRSLTLLRRVAVAAFFSATAAATSPLAAQVAGGTMGANAVGAAKKAMTVAEIEALVRGKQAAVLILDKVEQNCLVASLTPADEKTLSAAGAKDDLIAKLKASCVEKPKTTALASLLDDSKVTPKVRELEQSCTAGAAAACDSAAAKYEEGIYAPQDKHRAAELYLMACSSGIEGACDKSIDLYDTSKDSVDIVNAARLMAVQCERNIAKFCLRLGKGFEIGRGVPADPVRAGKMYAQACDFGAVAGCAKAADAIEKNELSTADIDRWTNMREKACKDGHAESCSKLGDALTTDKRFPKDLARGGDAALKAMLAVLQPVSLVALLATLVLLFGFQGEQILAQPLVIALLAVPILQQQQCIGVIVVFDRLDGFTADHAEFLRMFAAQVGVQVRNSQLYQRTKVLDKLKSEFVAVVSHEIRTPLTSVKGAVELLSDKRYFQNTDQQTKLLGIAQANAEAIRINGEGQAEVQRALQVLEQSPDLAVFLYKTIRIM